MKLKDKVAVVTGGANGIGRALCERFAAEGARGVVIADLDTGRAESLAKDIGGMAIKTNVAAEADIVNLVARATAAYGQIDLFCSNAGIGTPGGADEPNEIWQRIWEVNVMAHIYAARHVLPGMLARGEGYILTTASATSEGSRAFTRRNSPGPPVELLSKSVFTPCGHRHETFIPESP
jgi:NAD(P)-dependent dehydrogenase (short-subunit alcohol dehydrogenase family)